MNNNLISTTRHMQQILQELCEANVTVLAARIDMDYDTPKPHPFRFDIHAWNDLNFTLWAIQYHQWENNRRRATCVPFLDGQVFALYD